MKIKLFSFNNSYTILLNVVSYFFNIFGLLIFLSFFLVSSGLNNFIPDTFEWPVFEARGLIKLDDGTMIVPHVPASRIQIYDNNLNFVRGWFINSSGGDFKLSLHDNSSFYLYTARGNNIIVYDLYGNILSSDHYDENLYSSVKQNIGTFNSFNPFILIIFTHPAFGLILFLIGLIIYHRKRIF